MTEETTPPAQSGAAPPQDALETLRLERDQLAAERDSIRAELAGLRRSARIRELAEQHGFTDPDYLDYLLDKKAMAPDDADTASFMADLKNKSPKLFRISLQPGAPVPAAPPAAQDRLPDRNAELIRRLENAPDRV